MSNVKHQSEMEQTTSLKTTIYESSLRWNIEHFLDYDSCCVEELESREIDFADTNASWFLKIWPKFVNDYNSDPKVKIALVLNDAEASG